MARFKHLWVHLYDLVYALKEAAGTITPGA